jgi:hypothetical protein
MLRKLTLVPVLGLMFFSSMNGYAQQPTATPTDQTSTAPAGSDASATTATTTPTTEAGGLSDETRQQLQKLLDADAAAKKNAAEKAARTAAGEPEPLERGLAIADKYIDKFAAAGSTLLAKAENLLSKNAPHIWDVLVRQQVVQAISSPFAALFMILCAVAWWLMWRKHEWMDKEAKTWVGLVIPCVLGACGLIYLAFTMNGLINGTFNPEYNAIQSIVNVLSGYRL